MILIILNYYNHNYYEFLEFKGDAKKLSIQLSTQGLVVDLRGQGHQIWPRGTSRPRPGLEDYIIT